MKGGQEVDQKPNVHSIFRSQAGSRRRSGGFTMIEVMVVVGLIIFLLGIGVVAGTKFIAEGKKEQIRGLMQGLLGANEEYKARTGGSVQLEGNGASIVQFVDACKQIKDVEDQMMAAIVSGGEQTVKRTFDERTRIVKDPWGTAIEYRPYNKDDPVSGESADPKLPLSNHAFFVSAGPDKRLGTEDDLTTIADPIYKDN